MYHWPRRGIVFQFNLTPEELLPIFLQIYPKKRNNMERREGEGNLSTDRRG